MASLATRISDLATRIATECKSIRTLINGNAGSLSALSFGTKSNLVTSLNELKTQLDQAVAAAGATIDDAATSSTTKTYSVTKIRDLVQTSITALTAGAPAALDTLDELAAALGDDANFASTITLALANRVRTDVADQPLTEIQRGNARTNIDVFSKTEIGNPDTDFTIPFAAGLA